MNFLVLAKFAFGSEKAKFNVLAGPSFSYAISGKQTDGTTSEEIDFKADGLKKADFALQFGAGGSFMVGPGSIFVDARYYLGLSDLDADATTDKSSIKNTGIGINVGYLFPLTMSK